jgi:hypothetical protein
VVMKGDLTSLRRGISEPPFYSIRIEFCTNAYIVSALVRSTHNVQISKMTG